MLYWKAKNAIKYWYASAQKVMVYEIVSTSLSQSLTETLFIFPFTIPSSILYAQSIFLMDAMRHFDSP